MLTETLKALNQTYRWWFGKEPYGGLQAGRNRYFDRLSGRALFGGRFPFQHDFY